MKLRIKIFASGNTTLCTLHLRSHAFAAYNIKKKKKKTLDILRNYYYNIGLRKKTLANSICSLNVARAGQKVN